LLHDREGRRALREEMRKTFSRRSA
jgi:hypothetical protein